MEHPIILTTYYKRRQKKQESDSDLFYIFHIPAKTPSSPIKSIEVYSQTPLS